MCAAGYGVINDVSCPSRSMSPGSNAFAARLGAISRGFERRSKPGDVAVEQSYVISYDR